LKYNLQKAVQYLTEVETQILNSKDILRGLKQIEDEAQKVFQPILFILDLLRIRTYLSGGLD